MQIPTTDFDLFDWWRHILSLVCGVYAAVLTIQSLMRWSGFLSDDADRLGRLARQYVLVQILSIRVRRYWRDIVQIAALILVFAALVWAHRWVLPHAG